MTFCICLSYFFLLELYLVFNGATLNSFSLLAVAILFVLQISLTTLLEVARVFIVKLLWKFGYYTLAALLDG
jgi:hypothetical protein